MNHYTRLKRRKPPNPMSIRKIIEINSQVDVRIELCKRAGGEPIVVTSYRKLGNHSDIELRTVQCHDGTCEECGRFENLEPHEDPPRSKGGKVSMEQTTMLCRRCHNTKKGRPMWSKEVGDG